MNVTLAAAAIVGLAASSAPQDRLVAAFAAGDLDETTRQGARLGIDELGRTLLSGDVTRSRAARWAVRDAEDGATALVELGVLAGGWDRQAAASATAAAVRIARALDGDRALELELGDDELLARSDRWLALAMRTDRWPDVRVGALEVAANLARVRTATIETDPGFGFDLDAVLADADPELRRAGAELMPSPVPPSARAALVRGVLGDTDAAAALAAAAALCSDLVGAAPEETPAIVGALGPPGLARVRALVSSDDLANLSPGELVDAARCLAVDTQSDDDKEALRALRRHGPRAVRDVIAGWAEIGS